MSIPRAYHKRSRSPARQATEIAALALIHQHPGGPPAPRLLAEWREESGPILELSYEPEANLADLLSPTPQAHPLPPWYQPTLLPVRLTTADLLPLFAEIGRALNASHGLRVEQFGKLVGDDPNPHQHDG